jgi:flagellar biosynthetic protein FlhB
MFFFYEAGDRTEEPTPHRLREARRKGQVFKSFELNAAINIAGVMLLFLLMSGLVFRGFQGVFLRFIGEMFIFPLDMAGAQLVYREAMQRYFQLTAPIFIVALVLGLAANFSQVGFLFTTEQLAPRLNRLNPIEGLKRIFSKRALFELVKSILKLAIIGTVAFFFIRGRLNEMLVLIGQSSEQSAQLFWELMTGLGLRVGLAFLVLAFCDYLFQRYEYKASLKMSRQEIKEEYKHLEGDPLVRSRIRERQRAIARQRMLQEVPKADVVITNPTELAVALLYREGVDSAPRVVAKGAGVVAERIREIAREHDIAVVENPPVAQMLWRHTEVGDEIPVELYQAVAEILAAVYRLRRRNVG